MEGVVTWRVWSCGGCGHVEGVVTWRVWSCGECGHVEGGCGLAKKQDLVCYLIVESFLMLVT